ncbi:MAG: Gfo/Idh/MocA family oxidoreductase [Sphingomicrobium sp.]
MAAIRIAIIGFGKIAADQHQPAIAANPRFDLVASSSRSSNGPPTSFTDWQELLAKVDGLDAVAITTPPGPRYEIASACIARGLHVLLEKPPCDTLSEIEDLAGRAAAKSVSLFTTWHAQHNPAVAVAAEALKGKRIASLDIRWREDVRKWHPGQQWVWDAGGFGVFDPGINAFSIVTKIFPDSLFVRDAELFVPENAQTPIAAEIGLASPAADGPLHCTLDWRATDGEEWTIVVRTAEGVEVRLEQSAARLLIDGVERTCHGPGEYPDIYAQFLDLIDRRRSIVDVTPLRLVADCLLVGQRRIVDAVTM